jgi:hypothetical protein
MDWHNSKYLCTMPYSSQANAHLILTDDTLTYFYWYVDQDDPAAYGVNSDFIVGKEITYSIEKSDIKKLYIKNDICYIEGQGLLQYPFLHHRPLSIEIEKKSFLIDFDDSNAIDTILNWFEN